MDRPQEDIIMLNVSVLLFHKLIHVQHNVAAKFPGGIASGVGGKERRKGRPHP